MATRAIASRKRGLMPSGQAAMQSPVSAQPFAQAVEACGPSPKRTISNTPDITAFGVASPTPAGPVIGQISTHLPHLVQASSISPVRAVKAASKAVSVIVGVPTRSCDLMVAPRPPRRQQRPRRCRKKEGRHAGGLRMRYCARTQIDGFQTIGTSR